MKNKTILLLFLSLFMLSGCDSDSSSQDFNDSDRTLSTDSNSDTASDSTIDITDTDADTDADTDTDSDTDTDADTDNCPPDSCAFTGGITDRCQTRFMYGINYAWNKLAFAADFGGLSAWDITGVNGNSAVYDGELSDMKDHGINVIRWWLFPDFRGDGVTFDKNDTPTGLGSTTVDDIKKALELANKYDLYIMFTIFSFDNFRPTGENSGVHVPGLNPIVKSSVKEKTLIDNVVTPIAQAVESSPYKNHMIAWDVINEPEWAVTGASLYGGDQAFSPNAELEPLTHQEMEDFLADVITALRAASSAMVTVGGAAVKWKHAWQNLDLDFYQLHMYDWINEWWPYDDTIDKVAIDDKPVIMGEFFTSGLTNATYTQEVTAYYNNGYAGALSWQYNEASAGDLDNIKAFADLHQCETAYTQIAKKSSITPNLVTAPLPLVKSERSCKRTQYGYDCR
ncbi:MAG: cellulase family glycosylhydrolase [Deltaproteobacteria bacterium]|nr:cellulase family glycosylhydrolase [Deltaproteobacteria bacterium]